MAFVNKISVALLLAMAGGSAAVASTISFSHTTATQTGVYTDAFTLNSFDPSLGTLTDVEIQLAYTETGEVDIFNFGDAPKPFTNAVSSLPMIINGPDSEFAITNVAAGPLSGNAAPGFNRYQGNPTTGTLTIDVAPANFAAFESASGVAGTYSVEVLNGTYHGSAGSGMVFGGNGSSGGVTTVTYTYSTAVVPQVFLGSVGPTPEPGTMVLMGGGLLAALLLRRRIAAVRL